MLQHIRRKKSKLWVLLLILAVVVVYKLMDSSDGQSLLKRVDGNQSNSVLSLRASTDSAVSISSDNLHSPNAILVRLNDHTILMQKKSEQKIYPASLTKIMTATVAIENLHDLQKKIELSPSMFQRLNKENASMAGFQPNEKVKAIDLLYGMMLPSGAECCIGLADNIAGSEQAFVDKMNQKAESLGMSNTHFTNATGLQDQNHYTTVKDLSILLSYALKNSTFQEIFTTSRHSTASTNKHPDGITFKSTLFKNIGNSTLKSGNILGGKTGFTDEAGLCLASFAQVNGKEYILVTAGAKGNHQTEQYDIDDAYEVFNELGSK
ncbi:D-alanyl-D-alanine carboxypeptidase family protein [Caproiciproducens sp.]|uniref:D-alanyl-D-alanine carboxypeptidase family protein n=1 Tax=Caproiciproducens sp. TaxID=1954376 RepID=UPI00289CC8B8|nr:serine hydrolase [Caproiciproducens sp.]